MYKLLYPVEGITNCLYGRGSNIIKNHDNIYTA